MRASTTLVLLGFAVLLAMFVDRDVPAAARNAGAQAQ